MQKILIVSSKNLLLQPFDGSQKRIYDISKFLSKNNKVDLLCIGNSFSKKKYSHLKHLNQLKVFQTNFFSKIVNVLFSIFKIEPMQNGYFFSKEIKSYVDENKDNYDVIIFHLIRTAQYLPNNYRGKAILEMTDLISSNYNQIISSTSFLNPIKYLYLAEYFLLKKYELNISTLFDKVIFVSKKELSSSKLFIEKNKVEVIGNTFEIKRKIFKFKKNNFRILFVGNINYLPNKMACYNFAKKVMPRLNKKYKNLQFDIVGKISALDKFFLSKSKNVKIHGPLHKLDVLIKESICGVCNLDIATGLQNKIFTYMSYGLPAIISEECFPDNLLKKNKDVLVYKNKKQFLNHIFKLIKSKSFSNKLSKNGFLAIKKKFKPSNTFDKYTNII